VDGADGTRTRALLAASQSLSQLSYGPLMVSQSNGEVAIVGPIHTPLVVPTGQHAERDRWTVGDSRDRNEKAAIELQAVCRNRVNLVSRVATSDEAFGSSSGALTRHHERAAPAGCPLALNTEQLATEIEDQVVAAAFGDRRVHVDSELGGRVSNGGLGDRSLLVRCHIRQRISHTGWAMS
jgi:hypothetical protein